MRYRLLGRSGLRVSELALGTMTFGNEQWGAAEPEAAQLYALFRDAGGNFIDTANEMYAEGRSEEILGRLLSGHRDEVVLSTKYSFYPPAAAPDPNIAGNHRKSLRRSVEASLRRLNTDHIDLLWMHCWDQVTPEEEVMRALDDLVRQGKVLYLGVSNTPAWVIARSNTLAELRGWSPFIALQAQYNLIERSIERELLPMARSLGLSVAAWSPLASGMLSGKYKASANGGTNRLATTQSAILNTRNLEIARALVEVAAQVGRPAAQVALNWLRARPEVIPLLGARTLDQLQHNLGCLEFRLAPEHLARLDTINALKPGYPHSTIEGFRQAAHAGYYDQLDS